MITRMQYEAIKNCQKQCLRPNGGNCPAICFAMRDSCKNCLEREIRGMNLLLRTQEKTLDDIIARCHEIVNNPTAEPKTKYLAKTYLNIYG